MPERQDPRDARELPAGESADLCAGCVKCCSYVTIEVDKPRAPHEYDQWIWALHHRGISLYVERPEAWFIHVDTMCERLDARGRCSIHGRHPVLCRDYDPRTCERRLPLADIVAWFDTPEQFEAWIRARRPRHWQRLEAWRAATPPPVPMAAVTNGFIPLQRLAARPARGARRAG
jgi:putative zinc- or iron-chelating protein